MAYTLGQNSPLIDSRRERIASRNGSFAIAVEPR
jgi:hypothetical protein